jgi:FlaA1/EpsC-like NDP-sugar epimerase
VNGDLGMYLEGKNILITGVCGTVGSALIKMVDSGKFGNVRELVAIDNNESELFFQKTTYNKDNYKFYIRDIRNYDGIRNIMEDINVVFHCAALKHVGLCEDSPNDAINTNILGLQNLINAAKNANVERFIFTSSDKAVNPTNVMGTSKLLGEKLVSAANSSRTNKGTIFSSTRFGNVLDSRGSVIQIFRKQILSGDPVTLTNNEMTRFIMTIDEAASLVLESGEKAIGGEVFITKMPVCRIEDLANVMIDVLTDKHNLQQKSEIVEIGAHPGEKLYEELMSIEEMNRAIETKDYFIVIPAWSEQSGADFQYSDLVSGNVEIPYNSSEVPTLKSNELKDYLITKEII